MGVINLYKSLDSQREIYQFNGIIRENISLDWDYAKIFLGDKELNSYYNVKQDDIILIQQLPSGTGTGSMGWDITLGILTGGIYTAIISANKSKQAEKDMKEALERLERQGKQNKDVESIPNLSGGRNEKAEGKQVPIILGRHLFAPYFLSDPYMKPSGTDGIDLYWYASLLCGQTGLNLEKLRNGMIDLVNFNGDGITPSQTYNFDPQSGDAPFYNPENRVEVVQEGYFTEDIFNQKWVDSLDSTVELERETNANGDDIGIKPVIRETGRFPLKAEIELFIDGLHAWDSNNGVAVSATIRASLEWSTNENGGWTPISGWENMTITRSSMRQMRFIATVNFPSSVYSPDGKPVYIRARRLNAVAGGSTRDRICLTAIRTQQYNVEKSSTSELVPAKNLHETLADKFCRIGIKLKVNQNTQDALDKFNIVASMTGRTFENNEWTVEKKKTSNPSAVALEVLTGLIHDPSKFDDSEIDLQSFGKLYEYCENQEVNIDGVVKRFSLEANKVLTTTDKKIDVIQSIMQVCDGGLYINEFGKMIAYYDSCQEIPVGLLNPQRIVSMNESRSFDRKADGYKVEFIDQEADWAMDTKRILRPNVQKIPGQNTFTQIKYDYVTGYDHAMWLARRMMAKEIHRPGEVKVKVGKEGRYFRPGSLLKVQHEGFKIGIGSGEYVNPIMSGDQIIGIRCMESFNINSDRDYYVDIYIVSESKNFVINKQIQSVGKYTNELLFTAPINREEAPYFGNIVSVIHGEKGSAKLWESARYIVSDLSEVDNGFELSLVRYSDYIYDTTSIDQIPPYHSSIISTNPPVYKGYESEPIFGNPIQLPVEEVALIAEEAIEGQVPEIVAERTPRYRGIFYQTDLENTGIIDGKVMNRGDYIMFAGVSDVWTPNRMYEWNGAEWILLSIEENRWRYLDGINDLTDGALDGVFGNAFINTLITKTAIIEKLFAERIIVNENGSVESENFVEGEAGFRLKANGDAEFNNTTVRNGAIFDSELQAGALYLTRTTPETIFYQFPIGSSARDIYNSIGADGTWDVEGEYGNQSINKVRFRRTVTSGLVGTYYDIFIYIDDVETMVATYSDMLGAASDLANPLQFNIIFYGLTTKLIGLPTYPILPAESGTVYMRQSTIAGTTDDYLLLVKS